jgi:hypothetical protein
MNYVNKAVLAMMLSASVLGVRAQSEHGDPYEPVGDLTVTPTVVQPGVHPQMFWNIEYPEMVEDLVDVGNNSEVYTNKDLRVKVRMVGVAFQSGKVPLPTALWIRVGGGSWQLLFYGRYYDVNPTQFVFNQEVGENTRIDFAARGKNSSGSWYSNRWTASSMEEVIGLRNGEEVPYYAPAYNQGGIEDFLTQFIADTDNDGNMNVVLGPREMIYLFELGSTNPGDWWFDMQDLVAVVTFDEPDNPSADQGDPSEVGYVNFIRQIQQDSGVEWDISVDGYGEVISPEGVSEDGSFFQLWSIHTDSASEFLLDEQFVTSYTPNAAITIQTGDPYQPVTRTRADQPFMVTFNVDGLLSLKPGIPLAAQQVAISHEVFTYPGGAYSLEEIEDPNGTTVLQGYLNQNGSSMLGYSVTNMIAPDLTSASGEEIFTISALAGYSVSATVLDSKRIQIWPIAEGSLSGHDPAGYYEDVPNLTVTLTDLYPASRTYLRVYSGASTSNPKDPKIVSASYVLINDSIPQDRTFSLEDLNGYFTKEGLHTIEILHQTPFGTDLLFSSMINVDRTVQVTGTVFSKE